MFKNQTQTHTIITFKLRLQILMTTNDGICSDQGLLVFSTKSVGLFIRIRRLCWVVCFSCLCPPLLPWRLTSHFSVPHQHLISAPNKTHLLFSVSTLVSHFIWVFPMLVFHCCHDWVPLWIDCVLWCSGSASFMVLSLCCLGVRIFTVMCFKLKVTSG